MGGQVGQVGMQTTLQILDPIPRNQQLDAPWMMPASSSMMRTGAVGPQSPAQGLQIMVPIGLGANVIGGTLSLKLDKRGQASQGTPADGCGFEMGNGSCG